MTEIHIDTSGMTDTEKVTAMLSEIIKYIPVKRKKKAKEIREENRQADKVRKKCTKRQKVRVEEDD